MLVSVLLETKMKCWKVIVGVILIINGGCEGSENEPEAIKNVRATISSGTTESVTARVGERVKIECLAEGSPYPNITLRRENNEPLSNYTVNFTKAGNIYEITKANRDDGGYYFCVAENGIGKKSFKKLPINIEFEPLVLIERPKVYQALGYDQDLECTISANPLPSVQWFKDGIELNWRTPNHHLSDFVIGDETTYAALRVIRIDESKYGNYTCKSANIYGEAEGVIELKESTTPVCPPACGVSTTTENSTGTTENSTGTTENSTEIVDINIPLTLGLQN